MESNEVFLYNVLDTIQDVNSGLITLETFRHKIEVLCQEYSNDLKRETEEDEKLLEDYKDDVHRLENEVIDLEYDVDYEKKRANKMRDILKSYVQDFGAYVDDKEFLESL